MEQNLVLRRNSFALVLVGFFLGPVSAMLWLGRWKYALAYLLVTLAFMVAFFALPALGIFNPISLPNLGGKEIFGLVTLIIPVVGIFHALRINKANSTGPSYSRWYIALILPVAIWLAIAFSIRTFFLQPFNIPSASNIPSYIVGDYVFVSKTAYTNGGQPQMGDTAVFKYPYDPSIDYIKRIVGGPGDKIQMINGVLTINGTPVKMEEVQIAPALVGEDGPKKMFRETLPNGRSYVIGDMGETPQDNTEVYTVPEGHYFTLGDNRDNSQDSRFLDKVGYVPRENFVGPVSFRFWNDQGISLVNRPEETYLER
jgi:signal peptidase I